jgi:Ca2+-binding RTX toxin-like protein
MAIRNGTDGNDVLNSSGEPGGDTFNGGRGDDVINGGGAQDFVLQNVTTDGADRVRLRGGNDIVTLSADAPTNVRLTFTSSEVGNGSNLDSGTGANQDGNLAVRMQAESGGATSGALSRYDDEGIIFQGGTGVTFDVRDLVSGAERGEQFEVVALGTSGNDRMTAVQFDRPYYFNGGMGNDTITGGAASDFLVGGAGNDVLIDQSGGNNSFIGGGGADVIEGGEGVDRVIMNVTTDGGDRVKLRGGDDVVTVNASTTTNVRLTFTSREVGDGNNNESGNEANQDGGLAVRMQAETDGRRTGALSRFDDEGVTFVAGAGVTFDVRDQTTGAERGERFDVVQLGTTAAETMTAADPSRSYYMNGGAANDRITGGLGSDFLVGGGGDDLLIGGKGDDSYIGGIGSDVVSDSGGRDLYITLVEAQGADRILLGAQEDVVIVQKLAATGSLNVRLTFTSSEVGNGLFYDAGTLANQDGGLAVRMQAEAAGRRTGDTARYDDEGITFVGGVGVTFDVRDLLSGAERGEDFEIVQLGTSSGDRMTAREAGRPYYMNGGQGDDTVTGGRADDFLVGAAGTDTLDGGEGSDRFIGGGGADTMTGGAGADVFIFLMASDSGAGGQDRITDFQPMWTC